MIEVYITFETWLVCIIIVLCTILCMCKYHYDMYMGVCRWIHGTYMCFACCVHE